MARIGIVAIGRNEGKRLKRCLQSLNSSEFPVVYVDSGSTDGSQEYARSQGVIVVELDLKIPFTAARARNAGFRTLISVVPQLEFVQFIDGDCELDKDWLAIATQAFDHDASTTVVCGRRRESHPQKSVYNLLCDLEWNTPIGEALACGGDAAFRLRSFIEAGGYRDGLIAGEEPELCLRIREKGGKIVRIDAEMTRHDAALSRFGQWWKRNIRAGHAFAEVSQLHHRSRLRIWHREVKSNWFWGLFVPFVAIATAWPTRGISFVLFGGYLLLFLKILHSRRKQGDSFRIARIYAFFCVLSKFPQMLGQCRFFANRLFKRKTSLIEYKTAETSK